MDSTHLAIDHGRIDNGYLCTSEVRDVPGDGQWSYDVVRRVTGGLPALIDAYSTPDGTPGVALPCTMELPNPLIVWLHGDKLSAARAPLGSGCMKPIKEGVAAYNALTTEVISATKNHQVVSKLAADSGCGDAWKDMLSVGSATASAPPTTAPTEVPATDPHACIYTVSRDAEGSRVGTLTAYKKLTGNRLDLFNAALASARADATCGRTNHTKFAVILPNTKDGNETYVAMDGCAVQQGSKWWRAPDQLRALLK